MANRPILASAKTALCSDNVLESPTQPNFCSHPPASTDQLFQQQQKRRSLDLEQWNLKQQQSRQQQDSNFQQQFQRQQQELERYQNLKIRGLEIR